MTPGTDPTAYQGKLENGFCKEQEKVSNFDKKIEEERDDSAQAKAARPPLMRYCISHATLASPFSLKCPTEIGLKSLEKDSGFLPMFSSGSCSEIGPKQYMEDEYICVDDLSEEWDHNEET